MTELILTHVPESEHLTYAEAQALALKRDRQAADALKLSVPDSEKLLDPNELIARMARHGIRQNIVLEPPGVLVTQMAEEEKEPELIGYLRIRGEWTTT